MKKVVVTSEDGQLTGVIRFVEEAPEGSAEGTPETVVGEFDISKCSVETQRRLALHGASQKIGDSYAGAAKADDPREFARAGVVDTIKQLYDGTWRLNAGGGGGTRVSDFVTVLAQITGKTVEEVSGSVEKMDDATVKAYKAKPAIARALAKLAAERAAERAQKAAEKLAKLSGAETPTEGTEEAVSLPA